MKREYDFSKGRRGAVIRDGASKERITIRLDRPILDWFRRRVESQGFGNYQTLINSVLRGYVENQDRSAYPEHAAGRRLEVREGNDRSPLDVEVRLLSRRVAELEKRSRPRRAGRRRG